MKDIHQFLDVPIVYLAPFGRGGSIFVQGLFDRHPQVSVIPCLFPFLDFVSRDPVTTFDRCCMLLRVEIEEAYGYSLDYVLFRKAFFEFLDGGGEHFQGQRFEEIQLRAIHYAWSKISGKAVNEIKSILWHPHMLNDQYTSFFGALMRKNFLMTCRMPLESLISTYRHWVDNDMLPMSPYEKTDFVRHPWIVQYLNDTYETYAIYEQFRNVASFVAIEHLNRDVVAETRRLSNFLGIDFIESLVGNSTCMGFPMQQLPGKTVRQIAPRTKSQEVIPIQTEALVFHLFSRASKEIGYEISAPAFSEGNRALIRWLLFSNIWTLSFSVCMEEGKRGAARAGKGRIGGVLRAGKYYMQFMRQLAKLVSFLSRPYKWEK